MGKWADRFGEWDDRHVIYRHNDDRDGIRWVPLVTSLAAGSLIFGALRVIAGPGAQAWLDLAIIVILIPLLIVYVVWRRRRNRRLTGSATTWPSD